jgi:hypothetical protein
LFTKGIIRKKNIDATVLSDSISIYSLYVYIYIYTHTHAVLIYIHCVYTLYIYIYNYIYITHCVYTHRGERKQQEYV